MCAGLFVQHCVCGTGQTARNARAQPGRRPEDPGRTARLGYGTPRVYRLAEQTRGKPRLAEAIKNAPGNSIFFCSDSGEDVQRLSFDDFYQLDRTRSSW